MLCGATFESPSFPVQSTVYLKSGLPGFPDVEQEHLPGQLLSANSVGTALRISNIATAITGAILPCQPPAYMQISQGMKTWFVLSCDTRSDSLDSRSE